MFLNRGNANQLKDLHLFNFGDNPGPCFSSDSTLCFLSLVEIANIPLYLAVGPSLDVCVHSEATQHWIVDSLLPAGDDELDPDYAGEPRRTRASGQLERGILLKVEDGASNAIEVKQNITELLLYATVSSAPPGQVHLLTPASSSPGPSGSTSNTEVSHMATIWKVYALPISSQLFTRAACMTLPSVHDSDEAHFLAPVAGDIISDQRSPRKRKKISSLFEDAAQQSKRLKRHGGERVSKAMATFDLCPTTSRIAEQLPNANSTMDFSGPWPAARASLSRASSTGSIQSLESSRPASRRDMFITGKRSSLHRVESVSSPQETFSIPDNDSIIELQNKSALTRIVMAGMRVHGLQQRKKSNKLQERIEMPTGDLETQTLGSLLEEDSEYKLVYHQTFKAASFTFRMHMASTTINQETMRDVVDRLLAIFCADPLRVDGFGGDISSMTVLSSKIANSFDLPSTGTTVGALPLNRSASSVRETLLGNPMPLLGGTEHV